MPILPINGTALYYEDSGPRDGAGTILFSHGLLWSTAMYDAQVAALRDRYRCVAYDHRGQGRSADSDLRSIDMDLLCDDAIGLIETLALAPVHFCGLSMGGFVGMRVAARRPDLLASLALLDTSAATDPLSHALQYRLLNVVARALGLAAVVGSVVRIMFGPSTRRDPARAADVRRWRSMLVGNRPSFWRAVNGVLERAGLEADLDRIGVPTLVIVGAEDEPFPPAQARRIRDGIAGARLIEIPACGHMSTLEQPERVIEAIAAFLEEHRVTPARSASLARHAG